MIDGVHVFRHGADVVVAALSGEIDLVNASAIGVALSDALDVDAAGLVIDLGAITFIDSAGIRMLFTLASRAETTRQRLGLVVDESAPVWRLLKITNIDEMVTICGSVDECADGIVEAR